MTQFNELESLIESFELVAHRDSILKASKSSLRMKLSNRSEDPRATRIGGLPFLPDTSSWPNGKSGKPLGFLAQINLGELPINPLELPNTGLLSFFYDIENQPWGFFEDAGGWRVYYSTFDSTFQLTTQPMNFKQPILPPHGARFIEEITIPSPRSIEVERITMKPDSGDWDLYFDMHEAWLIARAEDSASHRLFGHPDAIQGCMQRTIQFDSRGEKLPHGVHSYYEHSRADELIPGSFKWQLLFQLDSDDRLDVMWGDCGRLFFWMHEEAIEKRHWTEAWMRLQCG